MTFSTHNSKSRILADLISKSGDKFFACTFVKKNGEVRSINARFMPSTGRKPNVNPDHFLTVYEMNKGYRNINKDTILAVSVKGITAVSV
jgi:hypothetical protein